MILQEKYPQNYCCLSILLLTNFFVTFSGAAHADKSGERLLTWQRFRPVNVKSR